MRAVGTHLHTACVFLLLVLAHMSPAIAESPLPAPVPPKPWNRWLLNADATAISPDGKHIAVHLSGDGHLGGAGSIILYDRYLRVDDRFVSYVGTMGKLLAFTPDSKRLVGHCLRSFDRSREPEHFEVLVWDAATAKPIRSFKLARYQGLNYRLYGIADKVLVVAGRDQLAAVYDLETGKCLGSFPGIERAKWLALSRDGKWLLTADTEDTLRIWDVQKLALVDKLYDHTTPVEAIAISDDGVWCASTTRTRVWVFERATRKEKARGSTYPGFQAAKMVFTPNGKTLVTVGTGKGRGLFVWDWQSSRQMRGGDWPDPKKDAAAYNAFAKAEKEYLLDASMLADGSLMTWNGKSIQIWSLKPPRPSAPAAAPPKKE